MVKLKLITANDTDFWQSVEKVASLEKLNARIADKTGFVILSDGVPIGVISFNFLWDELPFLSLIKILPNYRRMGCGSEALNMFEDYLREIGYASLLTSTQSDETAQHFYRKKGYRECGCLILEKSKLKQPMEIFFIKDL